MTDTSPTATKRSSSSSTSKAVSTRASSRTDVDSLLQPDSEHPTIKTSSRDHPISIPVKFECGLDVSAISDHYKPTTHEHLLEGAPDELATRVDPEGKEKGEERDLDLIEFEGSNDPYNPKNWSLRKKLFQTALSGLTTFGVSFASSIFSPGVPFVSVEFGVSRVVSTLGVSLFVLGFAFGPMIWGPISEFFGRKHPLLLAYLVFSLFQIPVAIGPNFYTIMMCRFFGGLFGSAPLAIIGGQLSDFWRPESRTNAVAVYAIAAFGGPALGPVVGGFVAKSYLGWRWTSWLTCILGFAIFFIDLFFFKETYAPRLLQLKAKQIRFREKRWAVRSKLDEKEFSLRAIAGTYLTRPIKMLILEPMLLLITIYTSFVYSILYLLFGALPIEFQIRRRWVGGVADLPFLAVLIGVLAGSVIVAAFGPRYARKLRANNGWPVPEERLIPCMIGAVLFPLGFFIFAWTSSGHVESWVPEVIGLGLVGTGVMLIFLQNVSYIIDSYLSVASSAVAANAFLRALFASGFPLFTTAMFENLGVDWAATLLGLLATLMAPIPFLFFIYGKKIRQMSRFAP